MGTARVLFFFVASLCVVNSYAEEELADGDSGEIDLEALHTWNWGRNWKPRNKIQFECPAIYGRYAHPSDCEYYYECRFGWPHLMHCNRGYLYDERREQCLESRKVKCHKHDHKHDKDEKDKRTTTPGGIEIEDDGDRPFKCPYIWGTFAHPKDCSKYYVCVYNVPALFQCYGTELYDERNRRCKDRRRVKCGNRLDRDQMRTSRRPTTRHWTTPSTLQPERTTEQEITTKPERITKPETTTEPERITMPEVTTEEEGQFYCPFPSGRYPDPLDCSQFYECHFSKPTLEKCANGTLYDERNEQCIVDRYVRCGERPGGIDDGGEKEKKDKEEFRCPYDWGIFPHPDDCSKYIICIYNVPTVFSCRKTDLFQAYYRRCFPSEFVTCDYRINPDDLTFPPRPTTIKMTTSAPTTTTTPTTIPTTTATPTTIPTTTTTPTTIPTTTTTPTTIPTTTTTTPIPTTLPTTTTTTPIPTTLPTTTTTTPIPTTIPTTTTTTPVPTTLPTTTTTTPIPTTIPTTTTTTPIPTTLPTTTTTTPIPTTIPTTTTTTPIPTTLPTTTTTTPVPTTIPPTTTTQKVVVTTRKPKPNTPPPTDCNEDDIDCIEDKTKDVKAWFDCPERYGHFPHASSYQLFIHCDNWRPFIKRCADETAFSPKYLVCMWIGKPIP